MECPVVTTTLGKIKGCLSKNLDTATFYSYCGIPYGKPPIGRSRFKAPEPAEPWEGIKDATKSGNPSPQYAHARSTEFIGNEDCLWLNVHTKETNPKQLKPVVVYFFGGIYLRGCAGDWGPEYLMLEDLVIVFVNFRVGALGLLALKDDSLEVPGNALLKDCVLALKWIQKNIQNFGGDPEKVTIWGHSSGGSVVHLLSLSPSTKGLIQRVIMDASSGVNVNEDVTEKIYNMSFELVRLLGKSAKNEKEVLDILQSVSTEELHEAQHKLFTNNGGVLSWTPVVEKPNKSQFLTKPALEIIKNGEYNHIPMLFVYANKEGLCLAQLLQRGSTKFGDTKNISQGQYSNVDITSFIPPHMNIELGSELSSQIEKVLRDYYFDVDKWEEKSDGLWFLFGDATFLTILISGAKNHVKTCTENVYILRFSFQGRLDYMKNHHEPINYKGIMHGDELGYMFKHYPTFLKKNLEIERGSREDLAIRKFVGLVENFAKTGNPTPDNSNNQWNPAKDEDNLDILDFGDDLKMMRYPEKERMDLWKRIFNMTPISSGVL